MNKTLLLLTACLGLHAYEPGTDEDRFSDQELQELDVRKIPLDEEIEEDDTGLLPPETFYYVKKGMRPLTSAMLTGGILLQGDIRTKYVRENAKDGSTSITDLIGSGKNKWEQEFNFYLKYFARKTTSVFQLKFKNAMGSLGGVVNKISLEKAYLQYNLYTNGPTQISLQLGRRPIYEMLESKLQFASRMDGAAIECVTSIDQISDLGLKVIGTLVDMVTDQFAYFVQFGIDNILKTKLYVKYAYAGWKLNKATRIFNAKGEPVAFPKGVKTMENNPRYDFSVSQFTAGYILDTLRIPLWFYGAILYNHTAEPRSITLNRLYDLGYYFGVTISNAVDKGTFSLDINYQYLPAQVIPGFDLLGIGTGNPRGNTFYGPAVDNLTGKAFTTPKQINATNANGNVNFQGIEISGAYVLTNDLTLQAKYNYSIQADKEIGPDRKYYKFEVKSIYAF